MTETMVCTCGAAGTITEQDAHPDCFEVMAVVTCSACGVSHTLRGLSLIMWRFRATEEDPYGDEAK